MFRLTAPHEILPAALLGARCLTLCLWLGLGSIALGGCHSLPPLSQRPPSSALSAPEQGRLARLVAPGVAAHPGQSGVFSLADPRDAFAARVLLADEAQRAIDVQYYIWRNDVTGMLLLGNLLKAADRGVRVRILLDDMNTGGMDDKLALVDAHPNVEVRLFNPFRTRGLRWLGYLTDFDRLNRRMHNKSFTVDNLATVIGGRNVGDEYFGAGEAVMFTDLDMVGVGPVVKDVSAQFDQYWASASSYPVRGFLAPPQPDQVQAIQAQMQEGENTPQAREYLQALRTAPLSQAVMRGEFARALEWAPVRMISDDPAKGLGQAAPGSLLLDRLMQEIGEPRQTLDLVSPYFVPTASGTDTFLRLARHGVRVRILTKPGINRCARGACRLCQAAQGFAARRRHAVRTEALGHAGRRRAGPAEIDGRFRFLRLQPACQNLRGGWRQGLRRLLQFRSALGPAQHRNGLPGRQSRHGASNGPRLRHHCAAQRVSATTRSRGPAVLARTQWRARHVPSAGTRGQLVAPYPDPADLALADRIPALNATQAGAQ